MHIHNFKKFFLVFSSSTGDTMFVGQFFKVFGIEFLIENHDLLDVLRDLTVCPSTLQLIDTLDELIELLKHLRSNEKNILKPHSCVYDAINDLICPDYRINTDDRSEDLDSFKLFTIYSTASSFIHQAHEFAHVITNILKLATLKKRLTKSEQNGDNN